MSSNFSELLFKFDSFWGQNKHVNLAKLLAIFKVYIWLNLAKFRPNFGYLDFFDLATLVA